MRLIKIDEVKPGAVLATDIMDIDGRVILTSGAMLSRDMISKLKDQNFTSLYISDDISEDIEIKPTISPALRNDAMHAVEDGDYEQAIKLAREIINEILTGGQINLDMEDIRKYNDVTYAHSVNVAVYAVLLGLGLRLTTQRLEYLALGGLLHDIGKSKIPDYIINKPGRLTQEEYLLIKQHPEFSYEILSERFDIPTPVKNAARFHHENIDGSGYPMGLAGDDIPVEAKVLHVVDVFDALVSDRPYKTPYSPADAIEYLMGACGIMFDFDMVECFVKMIPLYPLGTEVILSNGVHAVVLKNKGVNNIRPVVRDIETKNTIDLADRQYLNLTIMLESQVDKLKRIESEETRSQVVSSTVKKRILAVDDMRTNLALIQGILQEEYRLTLVKSGQEAVDEILKDSKYDLILMDIDMPGMNGVEAVKKINYITNNSIPVLFVSTVRDKKIVLACRELKAAGYVCRPYKTVYLKAEIERIIRQYVLL